MNPIAKLAAITALLAALAASAHAAGNLTKINPVIIPAGLDSRDTKAGMIIAVAKAPPANSDGVANRWADIVESALSVRFWGYALAQSNKNAFWYVESVEDDSIVFGYRVRRHYLSVRMRIEGDKIKPEVVVSENLRQTKDSIHPSAINWITTLSTQIRIALGRASALKAQLQESTPAPASEN